MTANVDAMVRAGAEAYRKGNKQEARALLERALELDEQNEMAWLWMSAVVDTREEQRTCLENVVILNPNNQRARQGLQSLGVDPDSLLNPEPPPAVEGEPGDALANDAYSVPSSSSSVSHAEPEVSAEEYDDWVESLDLGKNKAASSSSGGSSVFADVDFSPDESFNYDDDLFGDAVEDLYTQPIDEDEYDSYARSDPDAAPSDTSLTDEYGDPLDDEMAEFFGDSGAASPAVDDEYAFDDLGTATDYYDDTGAGVDTGIDDDFLDDEEFLEDEPASQQPVLDPKIASLFARIPPDIEATRLPGKTSRTSLSSVIILAVLLLLNVGAVGLIVVQLLG